MKSLKVLIVEDEILIAETIKLYLTERGHSVIGMAISYEEAIKKLDITQPDVILLDIRLYGEKSGLDVAKYLIDTNDPTPYIIVSSQYDSEFIEKAMRAEASGYITKPISKETLWSTIELAVLKSDESRDNQLYIDLKISHGFQRVNLNEILYIKSDHVYVEVVCKRAKYFCRYSLSELIELINQPHIIRCHRSYIINAKKVNKYSVSKVHIGEDVIPVSGKYKEDVENILRLKAL